MTSSLATCQEVPITGWTLDCYREFRFYWEMHDHRGYCIQRNSQQNISHFHIAQAFITGKVTTQMLFAPFIQVVDIHVIACIEI